LIPALFGCDPILYLGISRFTVIGWGRMGSAAYILTPFPLLGIQGAEKNAPNFVVGLGFPRQLRQLGPELRHGEVVL
jgi:hypothetical protein